MLQFYEATGQTQKLPQWQKELRDLEAEAAQLLGIPQTQPAPAAPSPAATQPLR